MVSQKLSELTNINILDDTDEMFANSTVSSKIAISDVRKEVFTHNINVQTAIDYTTVLSDTGKIIEMNNDVTNNVTIANDAVEAYSIGSTMQITQVGYGTTNILSDIGVTINLMSSFILSLKGQYSVVDLYKTSNNTWICSGDLQ